MRRYYKLHYSVGAFGGDSWYVRLPGQKRRRWMRAADIPANHRGYSNHAETRKFRHALRMAFHLQAIAPPGAEVYIQKRYRKHGKRWGQEYFLRSPGERQIDQF